MEINRVTITGADDSTSIDWMVDMSSKYPFVEWGILASKTAVGKPRFPSITWVELLSQRVAENPMALSLHVCGQYVREICDGRWDSLLLDYAKVTGSFQRVQLNFHAFMHKWGGYSNKQACVAIEWFNWALIMQVDGVNDHMIDTAAGYGLKAYPLYDGSGGVGATPAEWPKQGDIYSGYAGGLGPHNLIDELRRISAVAKCDVPIWIDMESRVRTDDNMALDCSKVERVLKTVDRLRIIQGGK